jgi:hypothetical protein
VGFSEPSYDEPDSRPLDITSLLEALVTTNGALVKREVIVAILLDNRLGRGTIGFTCNCGHFQ